MTDQPQQSRIAVNGVELALFEWAGVDPPLLFVHGNSFHARCWDQVIANLQGQHCYAVDLRGHGRSEKPAPPYSWRSLGQDVAALTQKLGLTSVLGIGHSLGGHAITLAAALAPEAFLALLLIDPVILASTQYTGRSDGEHFAARRRVQWESPDAMFERFKDRLPFQRWDPAVLRDYCDYGLLPVVNGDGYILACPPAVEADLYASSSEPEANIYSEITTIQVPVRVVRSSKAQDQPTTDLSGSPTTADLASCFRQGTDIYLPDHSHFIPMDSPALVAQYVRDMLARQ